MAKVVHVTSVHPALDNRILFKECRSLARAGHEVVLIAPHDADEVVDGVRIRAFPRAHGRLARMTRGVRAALRLCREERADVVHAHDPELMPGLARLARDGAKVVFDMHENVVADIRTKPWLPSWARGAIADAVGRGMRVWLRDACVVFAESSYPRDYPWITRGTTVLNLPRLDELLAIRAPRSAAFRVAYVGSITAQRGSLTTIEALGLLRARGIDAGFDLVGLVDQAHADEIRAAAVRAGVADVVLHGYLPPGPAYAIAARCSVGLAVLDDDPNLRDSYPTKLFEYMALGLPVIVSDFPLWRDVVDAAGCGVCVPPGDASALADALELLARAPEAARRMGDRGREAAIARYRWETEEEKLLRLYEELVGRPDASAPRHGGGTSVPRRVRALRAARFTVRAEGFKRFS